MRSQATDPANRINRWSTLVMLLLLSLGTSSSLSAQFCDRASMACNNLVTIPLDENCQAIVTIDMILEGADNVPDEQYELRIYDPEGNRIMSDTLREDYDCEKLTVEVECIQSGIYCWGHLIVEDKVKPDLTITPLDTAVKCNVYDFNLEPNSLVTEVTFSDQGSCEKPDSLGIVDIKFFPDDACSDTLEIVQRFWRVVDKSKYANDSTVVQTIYLLRADFSDFEYPNDTIIDCREVGDISVDKLGKPELRSCDPFFEVLPQEIEFPGICGAGRKISRSWRILDVCRNRDTTVFQTIEIIDTSAAIIDFSEFDIPMDRIDYSKEECEATIEDVPNPIITDCSVIQPEQLRAFYQYVDDMGQPFGFRYDAFVNDMETFDLVDIPIGIDFTVIFEVTDSCGNISSGRSGVYTIEDTVDPNAVCEKSTIVAITSSGLTEVTAASLDDHSFDNCGVVRREIRRMDFACTGFASDLVLGNSVHFCCEDVASNPIRVLLRVYDAYDNSSDCIIDVIVQDKRSPIIQCPDAVTFNCDVDVDNMEALLRAEGEPTVQWVCGEGTVEPSIPAFSVSSCGFASFVVTWTATDANGATASCLQQVTIENLEAPTVNAPSRDEYELFNCNAGYAPEDIPGSAPTVTGEDCEQIAITYEDLPFVPIEGEDEPCLKIQRTWTVLDWCKFTQGNLSSAILATYDQTIKIYDNEDPTFVETVADFEAIDDNNDCLHEVSVTVNATDDCTDVEEITYTYGIDINEDGVDDVTGNGNTMTRVFPVGSYTVTFFAEDRCGNIVSTSTNFEVVSQKAPVPIMVGSYPVNIPASGQVSLLASDLNLKSTQGCSQSEEGLTFAFSSNPTNTTRLFTCADIENGISGVRSVEVFVIDERGNFNSTFVNINLFDNEGACEDIVASAISLNGVVTDEDLQGVANIAVSAFNPTTNKYETSITDAEGKYELKGLKAQEDYMVTPELSGYDLSGVSTLDLVLIQRHILGILPLESAYRVIAADVNGSRSITGADLASLRRLILGTTTSLDNSWRFIKKDHNFDSNASPWDYPAMAEVYDVLDDVDGLDFIGLKVGDVNGNAFGALASVLAGTRSTAAMHYEIEQSEGYTTYTLTPDFDDAVVGLQLALSFADAGMELVGVDGWGITPEQYTFDEGELRISWHSATAVDASSVEPLSIRFRSVKNAPLMSIASSTISSEVYNEALETSNIALTKVGEEIAGFELMQNRPNPFTDVTNIVFQISEASEVQLAVHDLSGKTVYQTKGSYTAGNHSIAVSADRLAGSGIYYYTITTDQYKETKRMIVLNH